MQLTLCSFGQDTLSQNKQTIPTKKISIQLSDTFVKVNNKDLKSITIHVKNMDDVDFQGYLILRSDKGAKIATKDSVFVTLPAGKEIFVPSKVYINQATQEGTIKVDFALHSMNANIMDAALLKLVLAPSRLLTAILDNEDMVLPDVGDNLNIPIRINNRGNVRQGGIMVIAFPSALKDKSNKSISFVLDPFKDTIINFTRKVTRDMVRLGVMNVTVNGIYDDGNIFAASLISFQSLTSKRSFDQSNGENSIFHNNMISLGVQNAFDVGETYNLRARGYYDVKNGSVGFNFNMLKWKAGTQALAINSSNLDLAYKQVGVRLGNVTQTGDLSYTGRGAEVYAYSDSAKHNKFFAGYLDKAINLVATDNTQTSYGNSTWAGYKYETQTLQSINTYIHDIDKAAAVKNDLLVSNLTWKSSEHFSTDLKAGIANSVSTNGSNVSHPSMAVGLNFFGYFYKKLNITGNNAFSTAYYPGSRRGTLYLNEGIFLRLNKSTLSSSIIYTNSAPKYFNQNSAFVNSKNENKTIDFTYGLTAGNFGWSLSPQVYTESGSWSYGGSMQDGDMTSGRLSTLITFNPVKIQQSFYLKTDVGFYSTNFNSEKKLQLRTMLTYSYRNFHLISNLQKGNFYMAEAFQEYFASYNSFRLNVSPSYTLFLLNKNLKVDCGVGYNKDYYSNSFLFNGNFVYTLGPASIFTNVQYNIYNNNRSYKNIQFGLNYFLPENNPNSTVKKAKIELFVFYDLNMNGTYDKGDSIASGILVHVGKVIMVSGNDGRIVYNKLPAGNYSVFMPTQNGWYGRDQFLTLKDKETRKYDMALSQTGTVHGNITFQFDSTYSFSVNRDKAWQTVVAINQDGQRFDTKTDENGNYNLYLPVGTYTVTIDNLPSQIELLLTNNNVQPLKVASGQIINEVDFILKVKQRKVEVKKFGKQK